MRRGVVGFVLAILAIALSGAGALGDPHSTSPLARAVILPDLIQEAAAQLTPVTVELSAAEGKPVTVVGLRYCGADHQGGANALAVIVPANGDSSPAPLTTADCTAALPLLAARLARGRTTAWLQVARLRIRWRPWRLNFRVAASASVGGGAPRLGTQDSISTARLALLPPPGQNERFNLALGFSGATVIAALFTSEAVVDPFPYLSDGPWIDTAPTSANLLAEARYSFINRMLRLYRPHYSLPLAAEGMPGALVIDELAAAGGDNSLTVTGRLTYGTMSYRGELMCQGSDLQVSRITLQPPALACTGADMMAQLRCQAQQAAMTGSSAAVGAGLTNFYQGRQFHYSTGRHPLRFSLGGVDFTLEFTALRSSSSGTTLSEAGRAVVRRSAQ